MTVVGVIGGGQLARMMIPASINLGLDLAVFAEAEQSSAHLAIQHVGDYRDVDQLLRFAEGVDVITFDHEHVPLDNLVALQDQGVAVYPPPGALRLTHDKTVMRSALALQGLPQPRFAVISEIDEDSLAAVGGFPAVVKLPVGGYDGKGVRVVTSWAECEDWLQAGPVLLEEFVPFRRELAQLGARRPGGEWVSWPPVQTTQVGGVCSEVISPAPDLEDKAVREAQQIAKTIAESCGVVGVLAVELFESPDGRILVNELAMRPHNSGHVFTEQSVTSQFEQHLRAVTDMPLGSVELRQSAGVMVNIFGHAPTESFSRIAARFPSVKFHSYQKSPRPGRKAGHLVVTGEDLSVSVELARAAQEAFDQEASA